MKRKGILILTTIIVSTLLVGIYVIAKQPTDWDYYAYGTIGDYDDAPSATIVSGFWNLKVLDGKVWLYVYYMERNDIGAEEGSPTGSVDTFEKSITGKPMDMWIDEDEGRLYIFAKLQVKKMWAIDDGTYEPTTWHNWNMFIFDFDDDTPWMLMDGWPPDDRYDLLGEYPDEEPVVLNQPWTYDWDINGLIDAHSYPPF